jgi:hypothetical protein
MTGTVQRFDLLGRQAGWQADAKQASKSKLVKVGEAPFRIVREMPNRARESVVQIIPIDLFRPT